MRLRTAVVLLSLSCGMASLPAQTAVTNRIGVGCLGTNGVPDLAANQPPFLSEWITLSLTNLPTVPGFVFLSLGTDDMVWNGRLLPSDLGFTGMPGCMAYVAPEYSIFRPHATPSVSFTFFVPDLSFLVGCRLLAQGLVCDSRVGNPLGGTTTNAIDLVFGRR